MAKIRIVDEWLRSPVSEPSRHRSIMVVSSSWSEQRVLMRAFAGSSDQTRPTIVLHGAELAIGPAGTDPHSEWGIHVEPPIDGRAQQLREELELAAKRLAGSKGNPPRLLDEVPSFENKATNMWAPGTPRATPSAEHRRVPAYEPTEIGKRAAPGAKTITPAAAPAPNPAPAPAPDPRPIVTAAPNKATVMGDSRAVPFSAPKASHNAAKGGGFRSTPAPVRRADLEKKHGKKLPELPPAGKKKRRKGRSTRTGFESGAGTVARPKTSSGRPRKQSLAHLVGHTMPLGFTLSDDEREVLNALGRSTALSATEIGEIVGVGNGIAWMEALMTKLSEHGLDLIEPGDDRGGEPTYLLRS